MYQSQALQLRFMEKKRNINNEFLNSEIYGIELDKSTVATHARFIKMLT